MSDDNLTSVGGTSVDDHDDKRSFWDILFTNQGSSGQDDKHSTGSRDDCDTGAYYND